MESKKQKSSPARKKAGGKKKKTNRGRQFRLAVVIVGFLLVLALVLSPVLLFTVFRVRNILIDGVVQYSNEQIIEASGIKKGANIVFLNAEKAEASIKKNLAYIETAKVTKKLPSTVILTLDPSREAYALELEGENSYLLLDDSLKIIRVIGEIPDGTVLIRSPRPVSTESGDMLSFLEPEGESKAETKPAEGEETTEAQGEETTDETTEKSSEPPVDHTLNVLRSMIDTMLEQSFTDVTIIDITNLSDLRLVYQNRLMLKLGTSSDLDNKIALARDVIKEENLKNPEQIGTIDLAIPKQAYFKQDFFDGELPGEKQDEEEKVTDEDGNVIDTDAPAGDEEEYDPDYDEGYDSDGEDDYEEDYDEEKDYEEDEDGEE